MIYLQRTNNPGAPGALLFGGQLQTGTISSAAQSNSYIFGASANDVVNFTMVTTSDKLSPKIRLYDPSGILISNGYSSWAGGCAGGSVVEWNNIKLPITGTYTALIGDCGDTNTGAYTVSSHCFGICPATLTSAPSLPRYGVLSHIAAGGSWNTVITLLNTSSTGVPVTVSFYNDGGGALSLPVTITNQGAMQTTTTAVVSATINPDASLLISTGQLASTVVGWADVRSSGPVNGFAIFQTNSSNSPVSEGTVSLQTQLSSTITLPYDNTAGVVMGAAVANLSSTPATITMTVWDDNGSQLGTQTLAIAGNGHTSFVLPDQIQITSGSGGLSGLGLRFSHFGTFTSVPTM